MNTTKYGEEFERKVYDFFEKLLKSNKLPGAHAERSRIFYHKRYFDQTKRSYVFDCSIESYLNQEYEEKGEWSNLIVIECKRYKKKVDIGELDEFENKLRNISSIGIKGYFVTTSGFSKQAVEQANCKHYGLLICSDSESEWKWCASRDIRRNKSEFYAPIILGEAEVGAEPLAYKDGVYLNVRDLLASDGVVLPKQLNLKAPYYSNKEIKSLADNLYHAYKDIDDDIAGNILCQRYHSYQIIFADLPNGVYGSISFRDQIITISNEIRNDPHRLNFTLAHELGHIYLHSDLLTSYEQEGSREPLPPLPEDVQSELDRQADEFASCLLLPSPRFEQRAKAVYKTYNINRPTFVIDRQPFKQGLLQAVTGDLSNTFNVSKKVIEIKLQTCGLLEFTDNGPQRISRLLY